jgi:hypothetical protein
MEFVLFVFVVALTLPTSGSRSVGIVHSRTQATEFLICNFEKILLEVQ